MLRVCDCIDLKSIHCEYDYYVPFSIKFGVWNNLLDPTISLIFEPDNTSVFEIGFGKRGKEVRYLTLTCCNRNRVYRSESQFICPPEMTFGCPVLDVPKIAEGNYYIRVNSTFDVYLSNSSVCISFSTNEAVESIRNGNVEFLIDERKNIVDILISDIDEKSLMVMKEALL